MQSANEFLLVTEAAEYHRPRNEIPRHRIPHRVERKKYENRIDSHTELSSIARRADR